MEMVFTLFLLIVFSIFGSILGLVTGMLPGIHVNMVALLLLVWAPLIVESVINELSLVNDVWLATILICVVILSASVVHTFVDFIPSIFFGAPDEDTVLSVLPGHQMLLKGQGYKAVVLSAYSS
ncbi:MAG TPA: hypothetical protein EYP29_00600, partial [Thermoplasmata archaeon]|nr:hypothetical protein [Thermoplasmata archaeon]